MRGQPYTPCQLFYDSPRDVNPGDYIQTSRSAYLVQSVRRSKPEIHRFRKHLTCLRWPPDEIPPGATVHPLHWYRREKKPGRRLATFEPKA